MVEIIEDVFDLSAILDVVRVDISAVNLIMNRKVLNKCSVQLPSAACKQTGREYEYNNNNVSISSLLFERANLLILS